MDRARRAGLTALVLVTLILTAAGPGLGPSGRVWSMAAAVVWPVATLVISEVQTGGGSASDEFVEIANQGAAITDLAGLEVVYVTSSGSTVTRKATWPAAIILTPGQRYLIANSAGIYAAIADAVYSGGFAATGGALALRAVGGAVVDAIGWGDSTNAFVEGTAAPAPPAGSSLERRPGGSAGNGTDTNVNSAEWQVSPTPGPQGLASPLVPAPAASPSPTIGPMPTATPLPTVTATPGASPTVDPTPTAVPTPTVDPTATGTLEPTLTPSPSVDPIATAAPSPSATSAPTPPATPSPEPTATATPTPDPSPTPTATPTSTPTSTPTPTLTAAPVDIATVRALPDGTDVAIEGVLTTDLGALESDRTSFVEDTTGGIGLYLAAPVIAALPAGTVISVRGIADGRYSQRILRVAETDIAIHGSAAMPLLANVETGAAGESLEGRRIGVTGVILGAPEALSDGSAVLVDDGSGSIKVVVTPGSLAGRVLSTGEILSAIGPVGQRDSSGTGLGGYRLYVTRPEDLVVEPAPTPTPTSTPGPTSPPTADPTPTPTAAPTATAAPTTTPTATPAPTASPTPTPSPSPSLPTIAMARTQPVGSLVEVHGVVTAEAGRLGIPPLIAIADATGGIVVRLPDGAASPIRGAALRIRGKLAAPYGQLEIRPQPDEITATGSAPLPAVLIVGGAGLGEATEARLIRVTGRLAARPTKAPSGDISFILEPASGLPLRIYGDASSRIDPATLIVGAEYRVTGIGGQRASRKDALDGYRLWARDPADVVWQSGPSTTPNPTATATPRATPSPRPSSRPSPTPAPVTIAAALRTSDREVAVDGVVSAPATLLDASGRRIVIQDASAAVEVLLPKDTTAPALGRRVQVTGRMGEAYGSPRLRAEAMAVIGSGTPPSPSVMHGAVGDSQVWRLVSITGRIDQVRKLGDRWRAELAVGAARVVVVGQPGAAIPVATMIEGREATIVGIVRRAYPSASDRRPTLLPRSPADVRIAAAPAGDGGASTTNGTAGGATVGSGATIAGTGGPARTPLASAVPDANLDQLEALEGKIVRVGGLVTALRSDGFELDDGTATGSIALVGDAAAWAALVEPGDAINIVGRVGPVGTELGIIVDDPLRSCSGVIRRRSRRSWMPRRRRQGSAPPRARMRPGRTRRVRSATLRRSRASGRVLRRSSH